MVGLGFGMWRSGGLRVGDALGVWAGVRSGGGARITERGWFSGPLTCHSD